MFDREAPLNTPNGVVTSFFVRTDDRIKIVPNFGTGATLAGVSDVALYVGLSGIFGASRMNISSVNADLGTITVSTAIPTGASVTLSYASSPLSSLQVEEMRLRAESMVNSRLSLCYSLPLSPTPSIVESYATRLSAALLLIRGYGTGSRNTSNDGYQLYSLLMGDNSGVLSQGSDTEVSNVGEIGLICSGNYQLVDDSGNVIPQNGLGVEGEDEFVLGGRVRGRLFDITQEEFRFKPSQDEVDKNQPGSGVYD